MKSVIRFLCRACVFASLLFVSCQKRAVPDVVVALSSNFYADKYRSRFDIRTWDPPTYQIGERIAFSSRIQNNTNTTLVLPNMDCSVDSEFSFPHKLHILNPQGNALDWQYSDIVYNPLSCGDLTISPGKSEIITFKIDDWVDMRTPGCYQVWIELVDSTGITYTSKKTRFRVLNSPVNIPSQKALLSAEIVGTTSISMQDLEQNNWRIPLRVTFTNSSKETITIIKPDTNSVLTLANPMYQTLIHDMSTGKLVRMDIWDNIDIYIPPIDAFITIDPSESISFEYRTAFYSTLDVGEYDIELSYIAYDRNMVAGILTEKKTDWIWGGAHLTGILMSEPISFTVTDD